MLRPNFTVAKEKVNSTYGQFILSPLPYGYGQSLGNAIRRVLLSSIPGYAVTYMKINNVTHAFSTIDGVKESVLEMILNVKQLRFQAVGDGPFTLKVVAKGKGKIYGRDLKGDNVSVVNGDQLIAEATVASTTLDITLQIEKGVGYSPSEDRVEKEFGMMTIDAVFSPVIKTNFRIEGTRVGRVSNFDKLILEIWTDGTINPETSLKQASGILADFYSYIVDGKEPEVDSSNKSMNVLDTNQKKDTKAEETIIDELDLPTRVINALLRENIETVGDLIERGRESLVDLKGVGRKSIDLIEKELHKFGLEFN
ncbi:DNA-directed RNA polymerase subunit alpha [Candidatus Roizmanbacteria bacterium RIFCSPHIGHO2_01_FULL_39_12b]|uniref:DNA-directed RNA polymerase subunit alpha n=1 Tax=Candidatus Roizmanbacteria bacterium RIFCSPHIGHO2_01_FULL_39_12b TaxID=1802030 RepID=A0A1F7GBX8_9BACT|nr:MAG: DNA-directed RNA polymerase subunit alpha [Candidatus Roizmanbacteria bacterium RIFCSPHIGHO2_01_FULL_39_12b]OGK47081.1 MAG: DNA-directed RNA polymerase subunit alpha [Candidatus Roizmanbacteria bacterium RIFCSPLOWO2_01_FULL_39_19]